MTDEPAEGDPQGPAAISRRRLMFGVGAGVIGGAAVGVAGTIGVTSAGSRSSARPGAAPQHSGDSTSPVAAHGSTQAGIERPATPQRNGLLVALDLPDVPSGSDAAAFLATLRTSLARLSELIVACTAPTGYDRELLPDGPGDLSITVGLGPDVVAAVDGGLPGATALPAFAKDDAIPPERSGGDVLLAVYADNASPLGIVADRLVSAFPGATVRWHQHCFRGAGTGTIVRNPLGFQDGIIVPHGAHEFEENVWLDGALSGATVCVIRRLRLDVDRFRAESTAKQERTIGRHYADGSPLSGGGPHSGVNLETKTPTGEFLTPDHSHVRGAHPSFTGSYLMLRRGYAYDDGLVVENGAQVSDSGLVFICFQKDLRTFVQTQLRLDEVDDLMGYVTPTGSATFLILPGFTADRPLGAALLA